MNLVVPQTDSTLLASGLADDYVLGRPLGNDGVADLWSADDRKHGRPVVIKVLHPELSATLHRASFLREIATLARLQHPHILPLLDSGDRDGILYLVRPWVEGETLREHLERHGPLPAAEAVRILADVTDALHHAHARGIVHRE